MNETRLQDLFPDGYTPRIEHGVVISSTSSGMENQDQTNAAFSEKWLKKEQALADEQDPFKLGQLRWYLELYGYRDEVELRDALAGRRVVLDAGCGIGYKAAWFARLNPGATVVAMDFSDAVDRAADRYGHLPNMVFVKGDIAATDFRDGAFDLISCDQVLHHTENPPQTLREFARISSPDVCLNTYVYAKKALPRELLDEHFRELSKRLSADELWTLSEQLTQLGRMLSELEIDLDFPEIPALGIRGGRQDLQRFIYWNFLKCYWNPEFGHEASVSTNFDWYSPSNAARYSSEEFVAMCAAAGFATEFLHHEEACHSGRFRKVHAG